MSTATAPLELYRHRLSGHSHRVELMASLLGVPLQCIDVDLRAREQKQPAFLAMNAFGQVPVLRDGEVVLADSNAILVYLVLRQGARSWLPQEPAAAAQVQRWLSVAAGPLAAGPAAARRSRVFGGAAPSPELLAQARALLAVFETHLGSNAFLAASHPTIADIANYTYVAHAPEGDLDLAELPATTAWLQRIEALPGFVPMAASAVGLRA